MPKIVVVGALARIASLFKALDVSMRW